MKNPDIIFMRKAVSDQYDNFTWRRKVELMPDRQVTAIYLTWLQEGMFEKRKNIVKESKKYHQMDIFEFLPEEKDKLGGRP